MSLGKREGSKKLRGNRSSYSLCGYDGIGMEVGD